MSPPHRVHWTPCEGGCWRFPEASGGAWLWPRGSQRCYNSGNFGNSVVCSRSPDCLNLGPWHLLLSPNRCSASTRVPLALVHVLLSSLPSSLTLILDAELSIPKTFTWRSISSEIIEITHRWWSNLFLNCYLFLLILFHNELSRSSW